ncbi:LOW QUALITY PROTEIN: hypothetical protein YC2023_072739 [Brassica napus]
MEYEPPRDWWGVWKNAAAVAFKNGRVRIEAPVRLSHAESWREGVVIHCKGYRLHPREPDAECTRAGGSTGTHQEKGRVGPLELCRTISGSVDGKKRNTPETHGTRNGTHGDVGKTCVSSIPRPGTPVENGEGAGVSIGIRARLRSLNTNLRDQRFRHCSFSPYGSDRPVIVSVEREFEQLRVFGRDQNNESPRTAVWWSFRGPRGD